MPALEKKMPFMETAHDLKNITATGIIIIIRKTAELFLIICFGTPVYLQRHYAFFFTNH